MLWSYPSVLYSSVTCHQIPCLYTLSDQCQVFLVGGLRTHIQNLPSKGSSLLIQENKLWKAQEYVSFPNSTFLFSPRLTVLSPKMQHSQTFPPSEAQLDTMAWRCCILNICKKLPKQTVLDVKKINLLPIKTDKISEKQIQIKLAHSAHAPLFSPTSHLQCPTALLPPTWSSTGKRGLQSVCNSSFVSLHPPHTFPLFPTGLLYRLQPFIMNLLLHGSSPWTAVSSGNLHLHQHGVLCGLQGNTFFLYLGVQRTVSLTFFLTPLYNAAFCPFFNMLLQSCHQIKGWAQMCLTVRPLQSWLELSSVLHRATHNQNRSIT